MGEPGPRAVCTSSVSSLGGFESLRTTGAAGRSHEVSLVAVLI